MDALDSFDEIIILNIDDDETIKEGAAESKPPPPSILSLIPFALSLIPSALSLIPFALSLIPSILSLIAAWFVGLICLDDDSFDENIVLNIDDDKTSSDFEENTAEPKQLPSILSLIPSALSLIPSTLLLIPSALSLIPSTLLLIAAWFVGLICPDDDSFDENIVLNIDDDETCSDLEENTAEPKSPLSQPKGTPSTVKNAPSMTPSRRRIDTESTGTPLTVKNAPSMTPSRRRIDTESIGTPSTVKNAPSMTPSRRRIDTESTGTPSTVKNAPSMTQRRIDTESILSSAKKIFKFTNIQSNFRTKSSAKVHFAPLVGGKDVQFPDDYARSEYSLQLTHEWLSAVVSKQYPDPNDWLCVVNLNLSDNGLESLCCLDRLMPKLEEVNINNNRLKHLTGLPASVTNLRAASNKLTSMTDFRHLPNLQYLDISQNRIEEMTDFRGLGSLRELTADDNQISCFDGVYFLKSLQKMSLRRNKFTKIDFSTINLHLLEHLDLSENHISEIHNISTLTSLRYLNLEKNQLQVFDPTWVMDQLIWLELGHNRLTMLNTEFIPNIRTLFLDNNELVEMNHSEMLSLLDTFSARDQQSKMCLHLKHLREVTKLYLSGNPMPKLMPMMEFFKLEVLELSAVRLKELPEQFYNLCPGVLAINLNYNELRDIRPLRHLRRLRELTLIGNNVSDNEMVLDVTRKLPSLKSCDLRNNPFSIAYYPKLETVNMTGSPRHKWNAAESDEDQINWQTLDKTFLEKLSDEVYVKRKYYRNAIIYRCPRIIHLDGIPVNEMDRKEVIEFFERLTSLLS